MLMSSGVTSWPPSTKVQFPRFEYETNPDAPLMERDLIKRAEPRRWLSDSLVAMQLAVARTPGAYPEIDGWRNAKKESGWWGESHGATRRTSRFVAQAVAFVPLQRKTATWLTSESHDSSWDAQAYGSMKTELVLNGFVNHIDEEGRQCGTWHEFAALMINNWQKEDQRLVINTPDGWRAPATTFEESRAESMVFAMTQIALHELNTNVRVAK